MRNCRNYRGQGATQSSCETTYCPLRGQGATEYLVLLAVVLIVALVSVALLGFFPGMAGDAQATQSKTYWASASPISIIEWDARLQASTGTNVYGYIRLRNSGAYPIRITSLIGGDGLKSLNFYTDGSTPSCVPSGGSGVFNTSDYYYMAQGEEKYFGTSYVHGVPCSMRIYFIAGASTGGYVGGTGSICQNSTTSPGTVSINNFGFEYIAYIDNQQITKREIGAKPLIIKCREPY